MKTAIVLILIGAMLGIAFSGEAAMVTFHVIEEDSTQPFPCRIHLFNAQGEAQEVPSYPYFRDHLSCNGEAKVDLPAGEYTYIVAHGPEYTQITDSITVGEDPIEATEVVHADLPGLETDLLRFPDMVPDLRADHLPKGLFRVGKLQHEAGDVRLFRARSGQIAVPAEVDRAGSQRPRQIERSPTEPICRLRGARQDAALIEEGQRDEAVSRQRSPHQDQGQHPLQPTATG